MPKFPELAGPDICLEIYDNNPICIGTKEIQRIFSGIGRSTAERYKNEIKEVMTQQNKTVFIKNKVDTDCAFEHWGLDVKKMRRSLRNRNDALRRTEEVSQ